MLLAIASLVFVQSANRTPDTAKWETVQTKIGAVINLPTDMHLWYDVPLDTEKQKGPTGSETYSSHGGKFLVGLTQRDIPKDENPKDAEATLLDYFVVNEIDMVGAKFSQVRHFAHQGWPAVDFEIAPTKGGKAVLGGATFDVPSDFGTVRYRAVRTKTRHYVLEVWGQFNDTERQRILDSFQLPKEAGEGTLTKWGPESKTQKIADSLVEVWTPIEFKFDGATRGPDNTAELKSYKAEFGCEKLVVGVLNLSPGAEDQIDDSFLQQIIESTAVEAEAHVKVTLGEVKTYVKGPATYHYTVGRTKNADVRIDVTVVGSHMFIFTIAVPHGMLDSEEIKRFVGSFTVR